MERPGKASLDGTFKQTPGGGETGSHGVSGGEDSSRACKSSVPTRSEEQQNDQGGWTEGYKANVVELMPEREWPTQDGPAHLKACGLYAE